MIEFKNEIGLLKSIKKSLQEFQEENKSHEYSHEKKEEKTENYLDEMILYAFRYCLGRSSYAVGICIEYLIDNWDKISKKNKALIHKEINQAIADNDAGWGCDIEAWKKILKLEK